MTLFELDVAIAKLYVPFPVIASPRLISTKPPVGAVPAVPSTVPPSSGRVFHGSPDSVQVSATAYTVPPSGPPSVEYRRSFAPLTGPLRPVTVNRRYVQ